MIVNPEGGELSLTDGDRVAAVMPAALQTRTCLECGLVGADGFVSDVNMCDVCGTLAHQRPEPLRRVWRGDRLHPDPALCGLREL